MLGPTTRAVENRGSSTVNTAASRITRWAACVPGHQPAAKSGHPRDGLHRTQPGQYGMRIALQLVERDVSTQREPLCGYGAHCRQASPPPESGHLVTTTLLCGSRCPGCADELLALPTTGDMCCS